MVSKLVAGKHLVLNASLARRLSAQVLNVKIVDELT